MKIKWIAKVELNIVEYIDENDNVQESCITTTIGEIEDVYIADDFDTYVDMKFSSGIVAHGVFKSWFKIIES